MCTCIVQISAEYRFSNILQKISDILAIEISFELIFEL